MAAGRVKSARAGKREPRKHNPAAKLLRTPAYRPRVVKSKKAYTRKKKTGPAAD